MKREILKGLAMLMAIVGLALASAVVANGQSPKKVKAQVPFDFIVTDKTLRAGEYHLDIDNANGDVLAITPAEGKSRLLSFTNEAGRAKGDRNMNARLVFHRYGNTYFLSQVWMDQAVGRQLQKTRQERAMERNSGSLPTTAARRSRFTKW